MGKTIQSIALICTNSFAAFEAAGAMSSSSASAAAALPAVAAPAVGIFGLPVGTQLKATLVVCPVVAVIQWRDEIARHVAPGALTVLVYHGPKRTVRAADLQAADVIITTYSVLETDYRKNVLPLKVACLYCAKKYYPQQLKMHNTFWCGPDAQKSEAQKKTASKKGKGKALGEGAGEAAEEEEEEEAEDAEDAEVEDDEEEEEAGPVARKGKGKASQGRGGKGKASASAKSGKGTTNTATEAAEEEEEAPSKGGKGGRGGKGGKGGPSFAEYIRRRHALLKKVEGEGEEEDGEVDAGVGEHGAEAAAPKQPAVLAADKSLLHSVKWFRIVLDEAHCIKDRRSNTSKAVFALQSHHKWALSGTPLQNRVAELYSQIRFLQSDPYAYYFCKQCDCKSLDYCFGTDWRKCDHCGHSPLHHFCWWNRHVANPIKAYGFAGRGRKALMVLKHEVLEGTLLRRTKAQRADDLALPPRFSYLRRDRLDAVEEDFYAALYTQSQAAFGEFVSGGTVLNNYAHIFELLIRLRQAVCHPYLVLYSAGRDPAEGSTAGTAAAAARGEGECGLCKDPVEDGVLTGCGHAFCRSCMADFMGAAQAGSRAAAKCPDCGKKLSVDLSAPALSVATVAKPTPSSGPRRSSILARIDTAAFVSSTKIEALREELATMLAKDPSAKALVFRQGREEARRST